MAGLNNFEIIDHPSDACIRATAETPQKLFELCAEAMFTIMCSIEKVLPSEIKKVRITEKKVLRLDDMLISWLEHLLYLHERKGMLFSSFIIKKLFIKKPGSSKGFSIIEADVCGEKIDLKRHEIFTSIKAATYHELEVMQNIATGHWSANVIFDL